MDGRTGWSGAFASRAAALRASEIRELLKLLNRPGVISFAGGIPDPELFPREAIRAAYADLLSDREASASALQYSITEGYPPLRHWIAAHMGRLGVPCEVDNIVITSGSQQALDLIGKLFLDRGDTIMVETPTYIGALQAFNQYEPRYSRLDLRAPAFQAHSIRRIRATSGRVALAYIVADFANPTGASLDLRERQNLLALSSALGIPLVEDGAYQALRYEGEPAPCCLSLDVARTGHIDLTRTIYCGTFSKTVAPGLRIGWVCAARPIVEKIVLLKQGTDLHTSTINQMVIARALDGYDAQLRKIIASYAVRCRAMLAGLERHMPAGTTWTKPQGGMFVWVTLPREIDGNSLLDQALHEEGVAFVPGAPFFFDGSERNTIRLNFTAQTSSQMDEGLDRLGNLIRRKLDGEPELMSLAGRVD